MRFWLPGGPSPAALAALLSACRELDRAGVKPSLALLNAETFTGCPGKRLQAMTIKWTRHPHIGTSRQGTAWLSGQFKR